MSMYGTGFNEVPGITAVLSTTENVLFWGLRQQQKFLPGVILSSTTDAGNSPTTILRQGLILGRNTSTGKLTTWDETATNGTQDIYGILSIDQSMLSTGQVVGDKYFGFVFVGGNLKASAVLQPGAASVGLVGATKEHLIRRLLAQGGRFLLDDAVAGKHAQGVLPMREVAKTADYTVVAADVGTLFTTLGAGGAVNFTLPALAPGLGPFEFLAMADQNMTVTSAEGDNIVTDNDLSADSIAFSTASHKIGGHIRVWCNEAGTKWYWASLAASTNTITIAT